MVARRCEPSDVRYRRGRGIKKAGDQANAESRPNRGATMQHPAAVLLLALVAIAVPDPLTPLALAAGEANASPATAGQIRIAKATWPATARISTSCRFVMAEGTTGFVVDPSGAVLTTLSALCDKGNTGINFSGGGFQELTPRGVHELKVRGFDEKLGLVLLQITIPHEPFASLRLADSDRVKPGDTWVWSEWQQDTQVKAGTIPRLESIQGIGVWRLQLPGADKGEPLLDERGDVIGIVMGRDRSKKGTAIVLPINAAKALLGSHENLSPYQVLVRLGIPTFGDGAREVSFDANATKVDRDRYRVVVKSYGETSTYLIETVDCKLSGKGSKAVLTLFDPDRRAERFPKELAPVVGHLFTPGGLCYIRSSKEE